jgi:hypothetical protein
VCWRGCRQEDGGGVEDVSCWLLVSIITWSRLSV